jgi:hypothetical protein
VHFESTSTNHLYPCHSGLLHDISRGTPKPPLSTSFLLLLTLITTLVNECRAPTYPLITPSSRVLLPEAIVPCLPHIPICFHLVVDVLTLFQLGVCGMELSESGALLQVLLVQLGVAGMVVVAFTSSPIWVEIEIAARTMLSFLQVWDDMLDDSRGISVVRY